MYLPEFLFLFFSLLFMYLLSSINIFSFALWFIFIRCAKTNEASMGEESVHLGLQNGVATAAHACVRAYVRVCVWSAWCVCCTSFYV